ncbi:MAG: DNA-3-methyladenine glycosylase 2 family protein [Zhengella sp.]|uniref:DNA-3-methyladenine glycosylase family protein n=1 Tax=Zhengella sp. TaxID=2282762 RepID=UPI001D3A954E|nr:DNA-3-methyladenine glycosylase 2 family protein [Notoacmeibacter sp.]MCC0028529.1 DNA-3-methyladenine glycosylase 2 family protein [Brucellaceae bacterium]
MRPIETLDDIAEGLAALAGRDARLKPVIERAGPVPLRRSAPGFASLASIIVAQQVSKASADAIFGRLAGLLDPLTPEAVMHADDAVFRQAGLSRPKQATLLAIARAEAGGLGLGGLGGLPAEEAIGRLTVIRGVGPWTAEVYLLFAGGHPDIFPARDVALQASVHEALGLEARPGEKALAALAESWAPWRGVAARLFWAHYAAMRGRDGAPSTR